MLRPKDPKPPEHLGPSGRAFWEQITSEYKLQTHDLRRLEIACDCLDRIQQARETLAKGIDRIAANVWRDASRLFLSTTRALGLDRTPDTKGKR